MRKAFICPTKYVQGEDELLNLGYFVKTFGDSALLIADPFAKSLVKDKLAETEKFGESNCIPATSAANAAETKSRK